MSKQTSYNRLGEWQKSAEYHGLTKTEKKIWDYFVRGFPSGEIFESKAHIAKKKRCCPKTVTRACQRFVELRMLLLPEGTKRKRPNGSYTTTLYVVNEGLLLSTEDTETASSHGTFSALQKPDCPTECPMEMSQPDLSLVAKNQIPEGESDATAVASKEEVEMIRLEPEGSGSAGTRVYMATTIPAEPSVGQKADQPQAVHTQTLSPSTTTEKTNADRIADVYLHVLEIVDTAGRQADYKGASVDRELPLGNLATKLSMACHNLEYRLGMLNENQRSRIGRPTHS